MDTTLTHAVGIVYRRGHNAVEYLLVSPKDRSDEWVLPKGHIEIGEEPGQAALREVREEAGVTGRLLGVVVENVRLKARGEDVDARFYLVEYLGEVEPSEKREKQWFLRAEALNRLKFEESRNALKRADRKRVALAIKGEMPGSDQSFR